MWYMVIMAILLILVKLNFAKIKGFIGEKFISREISKVISKEYKLINDVILPTSKGTSQIDHIIVSPYGIFVIETKHYKGWIQGNENADYWAQTIYKTKNKFRNPIKQNWGHILALKETITEYKDVPYYSIIIFTRNAELKNINAKTDVIHPDQIHETIMKYRGIPKLSIDDVEQIVGIIANSALKNRKVKKQHVKRIKKDIKEKRALVEDLICPICNGELVIRQGKYGQFLGCNNYPKCSYIKK